MRADRLLKLADYLETVPRERFHMSDWTKDNPNFEGRKPRCGFAGCAIGWAIHGKIVRNLKWNITAAGTHRPAYGMERDFAAVACAFGISPADADIDLFGPKLEGTPKQVAKRIRKFVRDHTPTGTTP